MTSSVGREARAEMPSNCCGGGVDWSGEGRDAVVRWSNSSPRGCRIPIEKLSGSLAPEGRVINHDQSKAVNETTWSTN